MDISHKIVVPIYTELPHIAANLESLDDWDHLLIVDNSKNGWCKRFEEKGAKVLYRPGNIGVARSWNLGIKEGKDYTFFVSSSVFWPAGFAELRSHLDRLIDEQAPGIEHGLFCQLGWHANALSKLAVEKCGYFDENFYPAYEEDVDMCHRLYLAGIHPNQVGETLGGTVPIVTISAYPLDIAMTLKQASLQVDFIKLRNYYIDKWGGDHGKETYSRPFNQDSLGYFPRNSIESLKQQYGLT